MLSKHTLILLRQALMHTLKAVEAALLEGYGWTPRGSKRDLDAPRILDTERV